MFVHICSRNQKTKDYETPSIQNRMPMYGSNQRDNIQMQRQPRGKMKYPVIIGRKFLRANNLVIDPNGQSQ